MTASYMLLLLGLLAPPPAVDADELVRRVARAQRLADRQLTQYTFDLRETRTEHRKDGGVKSAEQRLYYVLSGEGGGGSSRELVEVNGRPATEDEKRDQARRDEKAQKRRVTDEAAARAERPPPVGGDEDDPLVGRRHLSDLIARFDYRVTGEEVVEGRPAYVLEFRPRPGLVAHSLGDRALNSLAGVVVIDAADFQVRRVSARIVSPVNVAGGVAASVKDSIITFEGQRLPHGVWFPCVVDLRLQGKKALFFRLDSSVRFEFSGFRTFAVETESSVGGDPPLPPDPGP